MQESHEDPKYLGYYDAAAACPSYAKDWDCMLDGDSNREELPDAYKKVSQLTLVVSACRIIAHQATADKATGKDREQQQADDEGEGLCQL